VTETQDAICVIVCQSFWGDEYLLFGWKKYIFISIPTVRTDESVQLVTATHEEGDSVVPSEWHSQGYACTHSCHVYFGLSGTNIVLTFKLLLWSCLCNLTAVCFLAGGFSIDQALGVAQAMDMALEINDLTKAMGFLERARIHLQMDQARHSSHNGTAPSFLSHFSAAQVYSTVCTLGVSILEREHK